jgi:hypothetical protein
MFLCPITMCLLTSPHLAADGYVYEESAIEAWIEKCKSKGQPITSPKSGVEMGETLLFNQTRKTSVLEFIEKKRKRWVKNCEAREGK